MTEHRVAEGASLPTDANDRAAREAALKRTFGTYPTGVTIVTTMDGDTPRGFTANSFTSVSIDPPLLLVCHGNSASSSKIFHEADAFGVNILASSQRDLAIRFASRIEDRFAGLDWRMGRGSPLLPYTAAWFDCAMHDKFSAGDHTILIGRVLDHGQSDRNALAYWKGQFTELSSHT